MREKDFHVVDANQRKRLWGDNELLSVDKPQVMRK